MRTLLRAARWCAFLAVATDALVAPRTVATTRRDVRRRANPDFGAPQRLAVTRKRYESLLERRQKFPGFTKPALLTLGRVLVPSVVAAALGVSRPCTSFAEVSEAKSLLEQMALVCAGRPFYKDALRAMKVYIKSDLRRLDVPPADLVAVAAAGPAESIMYLTSVGVPSVVYETVRDLRKARGYRLGAMQRKFPSLGIALLYVLAILEPRRLRLGRHAAARPVHLQRPGALFGGLCGATTLVLRIIQELWRTSGGALNADVELTKMVRASPRSSTAATGAAALEGIREMPSDGGAEDAVRLDELRAEVADLEARPRTVRRAPASRARVFAARGRLRRDLAGSCPRSAWVGSYSSRRFRVFGRSRGDHAVAGPVAHLP
ncbi:hypothetical protein JL720_12977 [Aureococcus anophagefferens]|nr:hypothetical protein JL720_12977 [Aureococcus anophagefferens]